MVSDARGVTIYSRVDLEQTFTTFPSGDIVLRGKLVRPRGPQARALAVWIEGSNNNPSTDDTIWQYALAARGVAVFVYDKRCTGASGGAPTSDFVTRADDTLAALADAITPTQPKGTEALRAIDQRAAINLCAHGKGRVAMAQWWSDHRSALSITAKVHFAFSLELPQVPALSSEVRNRGHTSKSGEST